MNDKKIIYIGILLIILIVFIIIISINKNNYKNEVLNIHFFDAGKADSMLLYNSNFAVLIDTGEKELGDTILTFFKDNNISKLNYLIITHFDKDHVGSAYKILNNIKVDNVLQSNYPKDSNVYSYYLEALDNNNIKPITLKSNLSFSFGDIKFIVNPSTGEYYNKPSNNSSLITSVYYKDISLLFMADAEVDRIIEFLNNNQENYDFIKIPYHGHYQDNLEDLIKSINPNYAVITSSLEELEDDTTLELLKNYNVLTYLTRNGDINLVSDGTTIKISQ